MSRLLRRLAIVVVGTAVALSSPGLGLGQAKADYTGTNTPDWAIGPFTRDPGNPILSPQETTGKVQFTIDGHKLGGPVSLSGGRATYTISYVLTIGRHTIRATYLGSASYLASTSHAYTQTVNRT